MEHSYLPIDPTTIFLVLVTIGGTMLGVVIKLERAVSKHNGQISAMLTIIDSLLKDRKI